MRELSLNSSFPDLSEVNIREKFGGRMLKTIRQDIWDMPPYGEPLLGSSLYHLGKAFLKLSDMHHKQVSYTEGEWSLWDYPNKAKKLIEAFKNTEELENSEIKSLFVFCVEYLIPFEVLESDLLAFDLRIEAGMEPKQKALDSEKAAEMMKYLKELTPLMRSFLEAYKLRAFKGPMAAEGNIRWGRTNILRKDFLTKVEAVIGEA